MSCYFAIYRVFVSVHNHVSGNSCRTLCTGARTGGGGAGAGAGTPLRPLSRTGPAAAPAGPAWPLGATAASGACAASKSNGTGADAPGNPRGP